MKLFLHLKNRNKKQLSRECKILIFMFSIGWIFLVGILFLICSIRWNELSWFASGLFVLLSIVILGMSIILIFYPFRNNRFPKFIIKIVWLPLIAIEKAGYYSIFFVVFFLILYYFMYIPALMWAILTDLGVLPGINVKLVSYVISTLTVIVFTHWGYGIAKFFLEIVDEYDFSSLYSMLQSSLVRVYTYGLMSVVYIFANIEKFAGSTFSRADWWVTSKDVIVEVFLTYVAVDSVLVAWKDHKDKIGEKPSPNPRSS